MLAAIRKIACWTAVAITGTAASRQFLVRPRISAATMMPTPMTPPWLPSSDQARVMVSQMSVLAPSSALLIASSEVWSSMPGGVRRSPMVTMTANRASPGAAMRVRMVRPSYW